MFEIVWNKFEQRRRTREKLRIRRVRPQMRPQMRLERIWTAEGCSKSEMHGCIASI